MKSVIWLLNYLEWKGQADGHCSHISTVSLGNKTEIKRLTRTLEKKRFSNLRRPNQYVTPVGEKIVDGLILTAHLGSTGYAHWCSDVAV